MSFCPGCGTSLGETAFVQEYWVAQDRHVVCWCPSCSLMCTVVLAAALVGTEPEH